MRGTDDLTAEQRPNVFARSRKMRGRAQPYRRKDRPPGPTLDAILKGAPTYLPNPADMRREMQRKRGR